MRAASLLLLASLLLAGCVSSHDTHRGLNLLLGVSNGANETIEVGWTVSLVANGTIVWARSETLDPAQSVERIQPLVARGAHAIIVSWGAGHSREAGFDTADCAGTTHLVLALGVDGTIAETTRECHE